MASPAIICSALGRLTSAALLTVPVWSIASDSTGYLTMGSPVLRVTGKMSAAGSGGLDLTPPSLGVLVDLGKVSFLVAATGAVRIGNETLGLTVWDAALDVYGLFRIEVKSPTSLDLARTRILAGINSVMQTIWSRADKLNYFNQETVTVTLAANSAEIELPNDVQSVIGPVVVTGGKPLTPIPSQEAVLSYVDYWYGGVAPAVPPPAYWISGEQALIQGDRTSIKIILPWKAATNYSLDVAVVKSVPRFTEADLINATPIRLPAKYVEALFLPLLRDWATSDYLFKSETARPGIAAAAAAAKEMLGLIEPSPAIVKKTNDGGATP